MDHHDEDPDGMMDVEIVNLELDEDEEDALMDGTGDDNEDLEEYQGLLGGSSGGNESLSTQKLREELELEFSPAQKPLYRLGWKCLKFGCIAFALLLLWTFALMVLNSMSKKASHRHHQKQEHQAENTITKDLLYGNRTTNVNYACPAHIGKAPNDKDDIFR